MDKNKSKFAQKFRKKAIRKGHQAKRKAQKKRRSQTLDWSSTSSESDDEAVEFKEDGSEGGEEEEKKELEMDPLTKLLEAHLPKSASLDSAQKKRLSPFKRARRASQRQHRKELDSPGKAAAAAVNPRDIVVRQSAMEKLEGYHRDASALVIQTAYRRWTSNQMVIGWVGFSQMQVRGQWRGGWREDP